MHLIHTKGPQAGQRVLPGETLHDFRGDKAIYVGAVPPHKSSSEGRVVVNIAGAAQRQYYPSVFDLRWSDNNA